MIWHCAGYAFDSRTPVVMGVLNVTPDSFSDGGQHASVEAALAHAERMVEEGALIIDVGGESTRSGAAPVTEEEELARVLEVVRTLASRGVCVSIDTRHAAVAQACVEAGASVILVVVAVVVARVAVEGVLDRREDAGGEAADPRPEQQEDDQQDQAAGPALLGALALRAVLGAGASDVLAVPGPAPPALRALARELGGVVARLFGALHRGGGAAGRVGVGRLGVVGVVREVRPVLAAPGLVALVSPRHAVEAVAVVQIVIVVQAEVGLPAGHDRVGGVEGIDLRLAHAEALLPAHGSPTVGRSPSRR